VRVISLLRSAVAEPGRRLNGALVILTVIIGVVTMHSMSGSPTAHDHGPHVTSVAAMQGTNAVVAMQAPVTAGMPTSALPTSFAVTSITAAPFVAAPGSQVTAEPTGSAGECADGCGGHDAAMAMCLMILVALLALVVPMRRLLWRALPAWSLPSAPVAVDLRAVAAPSLHELCISRT
jgi:hypothetical protein